MTLKTSRQLVHLFACVCKHTHTHKHTDGGHSGLIFKQQTKDKMCKEMRDVNEWQEQKVQRATVEWTGWSWTCVWCWNDKCWLWSTNAPPDEPPQAEPVNHVTDGFRAWKSTWKSWFLSCSEHKNHCEFTCSVYCFSCELLSFETEAKPAVRLSQIKFIDHLFSGQIPARPPASQMEPGWGSELVSGFSRLQKMV